MRIRGRRRRWALPPDFESSTLQPLPPQRRPPTHLRPAPAATKSSISFEPDALVGNEQHEDTAEGKNTIATKPRKYDCTPSSETAADTESSISSSSSHNGHWLEEDKVLPLKKRRLVYVQLDLKSKEPSNTTNERELKNSNETRAKRKRTEKIWTDYVLQVKWVAEKACHKTKNNSGRCNRQNGKGWRCSLPAFAGHTVCEHHLAEQRKKTARKKEKSKTISPCHKAEAASASSYAMAAKKYCASLCSDTDSEDDI